MFSLIITLVAIVVVIALALATIYYGGDSFNKGNVQARSAALVIQGQQINGAADLYYTNYGYWPADLNALVTAGYLSSVPKGVAAADAEAPPSVLPEALATGLGWLTPVLNVPTYQVEVAVPDEICKAVNFTTLGSNGILAKIYAKYDAQCYFSATDKVNHVIVTRVPKTLGSVFPALDVASPTAALPLPTDTTGGWTVVPTKNQLPPTGFSKSSGGVTVTAPSVHFQTKSNSPGYTATFQVSSLSGPITVNASNSNQAYFAFPFSSNCPTPVSVCNITIQFQDGYSTGPKSWATTLTLVPSVGGPLTIDLVGEVVSDVVGWYMPDYSPKKFHTKSSACNNLVNSYPAHPDYYQPNAYYYDAAINPTVSADGLSCSATQDIHYLLPPDYPYVNRVTRSGPIYQNTCITRWDTNGYFIDDCLN